jgi:hypothetical protein
MPPHVSTQGHPRSRAGAPAVVVAALALACGGEGEHDGSAPEPQHQESPMDGEHPQVLELARVIAEHAEEWLAIPGVEGAAVGLLEDGRTPCLQILVERRTDELAARLPASVEGHPVVLVESGGLEPLDDGR